MLLLGAGLLLRSVAALQQIDPGRKAGNVTTFMVGLPSARYTDAARIIQTFDLFETRLSAQPGVEAVGRISGLPLGRQEDVQTVSRPDRPAPAPGQQFTALYRVVSPGYFQVLGIPLEAGRAFTSADRAGGQPVMIVSRRMAESLFPGEDALGRTLSMGRGPMEIVGIAADVRSQALTTVPQPEVYLPHGQAPKPSMTFVVRSRLPPSQVLNDARAIVKATDARLPLIFPETMQEVLDRGLARPRFYLLLLALFAVLALTLAAVGVYGVVSYAVTQRTREIGVRMALGARRGEVVRLTLVQGLRPASAGLIAGVLAALWAGRSISSELYGVVPYDPLTFAIVTPVMTAVVLAACAVPALRATQVPPSIALRGE